MEKRLDAMKRITLAAAACLALASCGSLQPDEVVIAGSPTGQTVTVPEYSSDDTSTSSAPTTEAPTSTEAPISAPTTAPSTTEAPAPTEAPTTEAPAPTEAPTTEAPATTEAAIAAPSSTTDSGDGEVAVLGVAQVQDDDEEDGAVQELPRTGANEVMLLIAIGCAMIVGGRSLIDLVNAIARAIQRSVPPRPAPPR